MDQAAFITTQSWAVPAERAQIRLDAFVRECLPHLSRREVETAIRERLFSIDGRAGKKGERLSYGDTLVFKGPKVWLSVQPPADATLPVRVAYEDESVLIVDKPAGMATHGFSGRDTQTLANFIVAKHPALLAVGKSRWEPGIVHRLDRDTSGLVLVAKTQAGFEALRRQFRRKEITKTYWALVWGTTPAKGVIDLPLAHDRGDKRRMRARTPSGQKKQIKSWPATTVYRRLGHAHGATLLEINMATGVTHQIRVHLAAVGHPIVADALYGAEHSDAFGLQRHFLHALRLEFRHPDDEHVMKIEAGLPDDLRRVLNRLKIKN
jgi:23S rRNA pseudouridine1911/1915/1917 synthase